jgi:hypothetical protein
MGGRNPTQFSTKTYLDVLRLNVFGKSVDKFRMIWYYIGVPREGTTERKGV